MIVETDKITPGALPGLGRPPLTGEVNQTYCALDSCITVEILEELMLEFPKAPLIYKFERALQAPYLEIMNRGFLVDELSRRQAANELSDRIDALQARLNIMSQAAWGRTLNPRSPAQLKEFFYGFLKLPEVWINQKGVRKLSTNREALEKLEVYMYARPIISAILLIRDLAKQLEVFTSEIDSDGRYRTSYNIAGTETGRPSSSTNAFGTGGNAQNIAWYLRWPFIADPGYRMGVVDLEQVEARDVGFFCGCLFNKWKFLDSCESGDLHTNNAKLVWPTRPWTGNAAKDRLLAEENFYREFSFRDMSKRGGHLSNYFGSAWGMARALKIPIEIAEEFQARYVRGREANPRKGLPAIEPAFPEIYQWWQWTAQELQTKGYLVTPFGRKRHFFGRPGDDSTLREAIAFLPQSTTADRMNLGMWRVWKYMPEVQLLAQTYDSITFQFREELPIDKVLGRVLELIKVELKAPNGRKYVVPGEAKIGWNWGIQITEKDQEKARAKGLKVPRLNLEGLVKWKPGMRESRVRRTGLQRVMV